MNLPEPLGNNALVEIIDPHAAVSYASESQKKGKLINANISPYHITASAALEFSHQYMQNKAIELNEIIKNNGFVYWEEFANEGQGFAYDGKQYAFVAWWRLTGFESPETVELPTENTKDKK